MFEDTASGAKAERAGLAGLMAMLRAGDTALPNFAPSLAVVIFNDTFPDSMIT